MVVRLMSGFLLCVLFIGCGMQSREVVRAEYDRGKNVTTYQTHKIKISKIDWQTVHGRSRSLRFQARAACLGQSCTPNRFTFTFYTSGPDPIYLSDRDVTLRADGEKWEWERKLNRKVTESAPIIGRIVEIQLSQQQLSRLAEAEQVEGVLGSAPFELTFEERSPLRMLLKKVSS